LQKIKPPMNTHAHRQVRSSALVSFVRGQALRAA